MTVWNDRKISEWAQSGGVTPFDAACVNPASLDLRLGNMIRHPHPIWETMPKSTMAWLHGLGLLEQIPKWSEPVTFDTYLLMPGDFVLCASLEKVRIPVDVASILVLKSSKGRLGINHSHSGWGDPGFGLPKPNGLQDGANWTFEIQNISPWAIPLVAGEKLIQQVLFDMADTPEVDYRYTGHYVYQEGPTEAIA